MASAPTRRTCVTHLGLSDSEVGLHSSAMAIGLLLSGFLAAALERRLGEVAVLAGVAVLAVPAIVLADGPALWATLTAALLIGARGRHAPGLRQCGPGPGREAVWGSIGVARANVWAMVAAFACPVLLALTATVGGPRSGPGRWCRRSDSWRSLPWTCGPVPDWLGPAPRSTPTADVRRGPDGALPRAYWLAWAFLVAAIAVEFSIVTWAATLIAQRTGARRPPSRRSSAGMFLGGMFVGRHRPERGPGDGRWPAAVPAAIGVGLAPIVGVARGVGLDRSRSCPGSAMFVAGLGVAGLYPWALPPRSSPRPRIA